MTSDSAKLGGKAINLLNLKNIPGVTVPAFIVIPPGMDGSASHTKIKLFLETVQPQQVAVRSSARSEDSIRASFAGMYDTLLSVQAEVSAIMDAIHAIRYRANEKGDVATKYAEAMNVDGYGASEIAVIVQEMIHPDMSGVVLSHDLKVRDGYYTVSVNQGQGDAIVSGAINGQLIRVARAVAPTEIKTHWLSQLLDAVRRIETHYQSTSLDIEFAFQNDRLHILQCRPITTKYAPCINLHDESGLLGKIRSLQATVDKNFVDDVLGDMIDINPRELLGNNPSKLDISVFRYLFADTIVERVRRTMGYDPLQVGLLRVVDQKPYVSLNASAFSMRPAGVSAEIYGRMVNVYRHRLSTDPSLQTRVEFDVFAMSRGEKLESIMASASLDADSREVVRAAFESLEASIERVLQEVKRTYAEFVRSFEIRSDSAREETLSGLLSHVAAGTEMFVKVARLAFYSKNKFEENHPDGSLDQLLVGHIHSVSSALQNDLQALGSGQMSKDDIVARYGHLRPGQFAIFGESYEDDPEHYLFSRSSKTSGVQALKQKHGYLEDDGFANVVFFLQAREEMKFLFTRALHNFICELKKQLSAKLITSEQASNVTIHDLLAALEANEQLVYEPELTSLPVILPEVIFPNTTDLAIVTFSEAVATYISDCVVKADVVALQGVDKSTDVRGKIVLIPSADPGYDFLFHSEVAGIITKTGGPASHMCIRAIELQIPACIGCGEHAYGTIAAASSVVLDCASKQVIASS